MKWDKWLVREENMQIFWPISTQNWKKSKQNSNVWKMSWKPILLFCQSSNNNKVVDAKFIALISHPTIVFAMLLAIPSTIHHLKGVSKYVLLISNFIGQKRICVCKCSFLYPSSSVFATWMKDLEDPLSRKSRNRGIRKKEPKEQCNNGMRDEEGDKTTKWYEISFWKCSFETPHSINKMSCTA